MSKLILKNVNKVYPNGVQAVHDFNIEINDGEFIVLVGPSGCGKSTTLRMIAGLEDISSGELILDEKVLNNVAPKDRDIAMVFQNYALYAHMTVYHNMAFSLVLRKVNSDIIHEKVMKAADILGLTPYLNRKPRDLSGGQRQRVALGRAIVREPKIFLLDEPLSNLDAKLRGTMRQEIKKLHNRLGTTMIYVTHDQIEALTLADRIVIMNNGYVQQIGTPLELYHDPHNLFVANFMGTPPMNVLNAKILDDFLSLGQYKVSIKESKYYNKIKDMKEIIIGIRPEQINISNEENKLSPYEMNVDLSELLGSDSLIHFKIGEQNIIAKATIRDYIQKNTKLFFGFSLDDIYFFNKEDGERIYE